MTKEVNKGGRPPSFATKEELQEAVDSYFKQCRGRGKYWKQLPHKGDLALHLDINRDTLKEYAKSTHRYSATIKKAYERIESAWVQRLGSAYPVGTIFYLKNAFKDDYRDRYDHTSDGKELQAPQIVMYGPKDRLTQVMDKRKK